MSTAEAKHTDLDLNGETTVDPACFVQLATLALESETPVRFYRDALACIAESAGAFFASIHIRLPAETVNRDWCRETTSSEFWRPACREFLTEALAGEKPRARLYRSKEGITVAGLSAPIRCEGGERIGVVSVLVPSQEEELEGRLAMFNAVVDFASNSYTPPTLRKKDDDAPAAVRQPSGDAAGKALKNASGYSNSMELAFTVVNSLQTKGGCQQVALGRIARGSAKVLAISGFDEVKKRSPGVVLLQQAMEECYDHDDSIVYQQQTADAPEEDGAVDFRLHRQWHEAAGGDSVACLPLHVEDEVQYVVSLRRSKNAPFGADEIEKFKALVEPYAMALALLENATRSVWSHAFTSGYRALKRLTSPGGWFTKALLIGTIVGVGWVCLGTLPYRVASPLLVVPTDARSFDAPESATLTAVHVVEGDHVEAGTILCEFDNRQLLLERQKLEKQLQAQVVEELDGLEQNDRVRAIMARAHQEELRTSIEIIDERLAQLVIRAPFTGIVTAGDLRERRGDLFNKGEPLFQIAPDSSWRLDLQVPEADLTGIEVGHQGRFVTFANPELEVEFTVSRIAPTATQFKGKNVFVIEALTDEPIDWVRPGMEGAAKVEVGDRPVWWIAFHKAIDFFRVHFWL